MALQIDFVLVLYEVMVVGEGLLSAARFALRVVACGNAFSLTLESNLGRSFSSFPNRKNLGHCRLILCWCFMK
ncbi:TPA: hypothetical protein JAW54_002058 [Citrobacter freundii]|nr:hypothetical protein [Citrobacter freundii]HAT7586861.1 hypothetical protein [Citrobacter freundii]